MRVLIIDKVSSELRTQLAKLPVKITYLPGEAPSTILRHLPDAEILILNSAIRVEGPAIEAASNLKMVIRAGVGLDHIDVEALEKRGVVVHNTAGGNADAVGEHAVGMLLALRHHLLRADQEVRRGIWRREANRGVEIKGKTIGIVGFGHTGSAVARKLSGFECRLLAYDKYKSGFGGQLVEEVQMRAIFEQADIVTLHVPLTEETRYLVNHEWLGRFSKPITLLNLSRGMVVNLFDLLNALDNGRVTAAALDVLENEKLDTLTTEQEQIYDRLFKHEKVMLSPHIGGWTVESRQNIDRMILDFVAEAIPE